MPPGTVIAKMPDVGAIAPREVYMKKTAFIALLLVIGMVLAFPRPSYPCGPGWVIGAAAAVVGATLLGAAACPGYGYYRPPSVAYAYPPPAYAYPPPAYGYRHHYYGPRHYPYRYRGYYGPRYYGYR